MGMVLISFCQGYDGEPRQLSDKEWYYKLLVKTFRCEGLWLNRVNVAFFAIAQSEQGFSGMAQAKFQPGHSEKSELLVLASWFSHCFSVPLRKTTIESVGEGCKKA